MNQFKFEWLKVMKTKTNFFALILFLILLFLGVVFTQSDEEMKLVRMDLIQEKISMSENAVENMKDIPEAKNAVKDTQESLELMENLRDAYNIDDNNKIAQAEYENDKNDLKDVASGSLVGPSLIEQKKLVATGEYLIHHDIDKVDRFFQQVPSINYFYNIFNGGMPSNLIFMVISLVLANIYTLEKRNNNIEFLNTIPYNLYKLVIMKTLVATSFVIIGILICFTIIFIVNGFINGFGNLNYPLAYSIDGDNVLIMSMSKFIFKIFILIIFFVLFFSSLSYLISLFSGSILLNAIILIGIVLIADSTLLDQEAFKSFAHLFPFSYLDISNVIQYGNEYNPLPSTSITFRNGMICLTVYTLVITLISNLIIWQSKKV